MAKIRREGAGEFCHFYPQLATVVTVRAKDRRNAMAVAWGGPISFAPPLYGVSITTVHRIGREEVFAS